MRPNLNYFGEIDSAKRIAIIVHKNSDMDAIGSAVALKRIIKKNSKQKERIIDIFSDTFNIESDNIQKNLYAPFLKNEDVNKKSCKQYDLAICLDTANNKLLGKYESILKIAKDTLNIDHHQTNTVYANKNIVLPKYSSTCEIIYQLLIKMRHLKYSGDIARLIYAGIITDTNNLTNNLYKSTFKFIDEISGNNTKVMVELERIRNYFFKNESKAKFELLKKALQSTKFACDGKMAMMKFTKKDISDAKAVMTDTLGIVDYATKIQGVEVACMFIKQSDNSYYVSLRSKNDIDVGKIAAQFGGGGHTKIAAFQTKKNVSLPDLKNKLVSICEQELKDYDVIDDLNDLFVEE